MQVNAFKILNSSICPLGKLMTVSLTTKINTNLTIKCPSMLKHYFVHACRPKKILKVTLHNRASTVTAPSSEPTIGNYSCGK